jgi:hypothetical protein
MLYANVMKKHQTVFKLMPFILFGLVCVSFLTGCATSIPIKSVRPPTIDTSSVQRLAIKPFADKSGMRSRLGIDLAEYLTNKAMEFAANAGKFTIVASSDPNAEAVFTGEIISIEESNEREREELTDNEGKSYIETTFIREVRVIFSYSIISTRTDMPIGTVTKEGTSSDSSTSYFELSDTLTLAREVIDNQLDTLQQDIVPTIVSTNRKLMKETSKDKALKQMMKDVQTLVKNGNYPEAIRQYDEIAHRYGSTAALTNSDILKEAIASDIAANAELAQFFNDTSGLRDKAAADASASLHERLADGTTIMIAKTHSTEARMLDDVVDEMIKTIIQEDRLRVVDRSHQSLIDAEQQFQHSGYVDDDSMVSIGRQLGVQYIIVCWISGEKSLRAFNLKVINVESAQIVNQDSFEI